MPLGNSNSFPASPTDKRLSANGERAIKALSRALGSGAHDIKPVQSRAGQMFSFSLPGDERKSQGRMLISAGGEVKIWHQSLQRPWLNDPAFRGIEVGGSDKGRGPTPGYSIGLKEFEQIESGLLAKVREQPKQISRPTQATERLRPQISDAEVHALALQSLAAHGWDARRSNGGITTFDDAHGRGHAGRMIVKDGLAVVWSHRGDVPRLGEPWRPGLPTSSGLPTMIATGRDLAGIGLNVSRPAPVQFSQAQQLPESEKIAAIQSVWTRLVEHSQACPPDHRHLVKGTSTPDKALPPADLIVIPEGKLEGAIAMPMLRESEVNGQLQVVGVQALLTGPAAEGNDKQLLTNSSISGSFTPWPLPPVRDGKFDLAAWVESRDKTKPIVLCEGVATALAVHHSGAGHGVICYSSSNLPIVAKYFADRELDATHGIVVASDNDIALKRDGTLKSPGVLKALEAARECGGEVAFLGKTGAVGADARDLYVQDGPSAVQRYIKRAQRPDEVQQRFEKVIQERRDAMEKPQSLER